MLTIENLEELLKTPESDSFQDKNLQELKGVPESDSFITRNCEEDLSAHVSNEVNISDTDEVTHVDETLTLSGTPPIKTHDFSCIADCGYSDNDESMLV